MKMQFRFLVGAEDVRTDEEGYICGRIPETATSIDTDPDLPGRLAYELANWRDSPEAIEKFIRKFGPPDRFDVDANGSFRVTRDSWVDLQKRIRTLWALISARDANFSFSTSGQDHHGFSYNPWPPNGPIFKYTNGTRDLTAIFSLDLFLCPPTRIKICDRHDCPAPFFIAKRASQKFCGVDCKDWGLNQSKLEWWHKNKARAKGRAKTTNTQRLTAPHAKRKTNPTR